jgi:uncharacterized membrane protein YukC
MPNRKIGRILAELEEALVQEDLSEEAASEYADGLEQEIDDLLDEEENDTSDTGQETG